MPHPAESEMIHSIEKMIGELMRRLSKTAWKRVAVYLGVSVAGLALFLAAYCLISGRPVLEALDSFWIAIAISLAVSAVTAVRDQREEPGTTPGDQDL